MKGVRIAAVSAVCVLAAVWLCVAVYSSLTLPPTYNGSSVNVLDLYRDPENTDLSDPDGAAAVIVQENLSRTGAANNVASVVFDFRGFDTLGESFILLTAIAGTYVILSRKKKKDEKKEDASDEV